MIFSSPEERLPPTCPQCKAEIVLSTLEMQLDVNQSTQFNTLMLCFVLCKKTANEVVLHCPFCNYCEIRDRMGINFVFCGNEACKKRSCHFCYLECPYETENNDSGQEDNTDDDDDDDEIEDKGAVKHFVCAELNDTKKKIEKAIEDGSKVYCPKCGVGGRKDDACTHMSCVKCGTCFCYFCGMSEKECEKEANSSNIYGHNANWPDTEKRCPMYLSEISDVDDRWPDDDSQCLDFFHRLRIMQNLKKVIGECDMEKIKKVEEKYKCIENTGLDIREILREDITLIIRE